MSNAQPLTAPDRRERYEAQNGGSELTPTQRRRLARKDHAAIGDPADATPKRPKPGVRSQPLKGRKRYYAEFMRAHYARARHEARRQRQKLGRFTAPRR
jgi:hypothetical protein